jgi:hypothetical protein
MKILATCLTLVLISHTTLAFAQNPSKGKRGSSKASTGYGVPQQQFGFGAPVAGQIHHSSTYEEGVARAQAAIIQAQGQYNLLTSLALRNMAEYQQKQFEFQQQLTVAKKAMYREYQERRNADLAARRSGNHSGKAQVAQR